MCSLTEKDGGELRPFVFKALLQIEHLPDSIQMLLFRAYCAKLVLVSIMGLPKTNAQESSALDNLFIFLFF